MRQRHVRSAFSGEGARLFGGRWNYPGTALVYLAESRALAALEMLVHLDGADLLGGYVTIGVQFDDSLVESLAPDRIGPDLTGNAIRDLGEEWVASRRTPVLRVPSVIIPGEFNFLVNPRHPRSADLVIGPPEPFRFDQRLSRQL